MPRALLITGSRRLAADPPAERWACDLIAAAVARLAPGDVVMTGGAIGPDLWALAEARARGVTRLELRLDGVRYEDETPGRPWYDTAQVAPWETAAWPLDRNRALVATAARAKAAGYAVAVLALIDARSETYGTKFTCQVAREAGLDVFENTFAMPAQGLRACDENTWGDNRRTPDPPVVASHEPLLVVPERLPVVWLDTETGGRSEKHHALLEIAALECTPDSRRILRAFEVRLRPADGFSVEPEAAAINGYTAELWRDARPARAGLEEFLAWLPKRFVLGAYNNTFDKRFLAYHAKWHNLAEPGWAKQALDPLPIARRVLKNRGLTENARLATICDHYGIESRGGHAAMVDTQRARMVYLKLLNHEPDEQDVVDGAMTVDGPA